MKSSETNERLSRVLADWRVVPPREPQFRGAVAARIAGARRRATWLGYVRAHAAVLTGVLALVLLAGAWAGAEQARTRVEADRAAIASAYVHAMDARTMRMP
jgi:hypothetical protein